MTLCKKRSERKGGKFIAHRCRGLAIWLGGGAGKENRVPAAAAVVNKVTAREGRWWVWFIRSFKGVMWHAVWNWLSLKEPSGDMRSGGKVKICVCLWLDNIPYTHPHTHSHAYKFCASSCSLCFPSSQYFISSLGKATVMGLPTTLTTLWHHH